MRFLLALVLALSAAPQGAWAADRDVPVSSFSRVRIEGAFTVTIATGASPAARVSGDLDAIERVDVAQNGDTLVIRMGGAGWGERPAAKRAGPVVIALATPRLGGIALGTGAEVRAGAMRAPRVDLSVVGAGKLAVERIETDQLVATVVGPGAITAAGKAAAARLMVNGEGAITAPELSAGDLVARVEGPGQLSVGARYTAQVTATGLGAVTVLGAPKCQVRAPAGATVRCGN